MSVWVLDGVSAADGALTYKGGLSAEHVVSVAGASEVFKFSHGTRVRCRKGPYAGRGALVVVGTTAASKSLVLHDETPETGGAFVVPHCQDFTQLCTEHDPHVVEPHTVFSEYRDVRGPLGYTYAMNIESARLADVFGVDYGAKVFFRTTGPAVIAGVFLGVLWVTPLGKTDAVPLVGGTNETTLLHLHGLQDADDNGATSPRTPRTPGRGPGSAQDQPYVVYAEKQTARCVGPFGAKVEVSLDQRALSVFAVKHGQSLVATRGIDAGKRFTVIGARSGTLYIHGEGDRRVTVCRNCAGAADLEATFGFGLPVARPKSPGRMISSPEMKASVPPLAFAPPKAITPRSTTNGGGDNIHAALTPTSSSARLSSSASNGEQKPCWTANGRPTFDISQKACQGFGLAHGDLVEATTGGDAGRRFSIFGVRHGSLWAIPEGSSRATAFRFCNDKASLHERYRFRMVGETDMEPFYDAPEPGKTPLHSPRQFLPAETASGTPNASRSHAEQRRLSDDFVSVPRQQQQQQAAPTVAAGSGSSTGARPPLVPTLALAKALPETTHQGDRQRSTTAPPAYTVAADTTSATIPAAIPHRHSSSSSGEEFIPGQMPATRLYLQAFALFKSGIRHAQPEAAQAFHEYYGTDPVGRLNDAMAALPTFVRHWESSSDRGVVFSEADEQEMLQEMHTSPTALG